MVGAEKGVLRWARALFQLPGHTPLPKIEGTLPYLLLPPSLPSSPEHKRDTMDPCETTVPIGTYCVVPETKLYDKVSRHQGFYDPETLGHMKEQTLRDIAYHAAFVAAGCPPTPSSEWYGWQKSVITETQALAWWDASRQFLHVLTGALAFLDTEEGKKEVAYEEAYRNLRMTNRALDNMSSGAACRGIFQAIEDEEQELADLEETMRKERWYKNETSCESIHYEVGLAWSEIMKGLGRKTEFILCAGPRW
jgi:uncharacterized lipoprotein NlpE involved in copper resistance